MKNRLISLLLCAAVLLCLSGCKQEEPQKTGLLTGDELAFYLDQIGKPSEEVMESLSLTEEQIVEKSDQETGWLVSETREIEGEPFTQKLLFESPNSPQILYGYQYTLAPDPLYDEEKMKELTIAIALKATELYGDPITYPNGSNRLFHEDGTPKREKKIAFIKTWDIREVWEISENEALVLRASLSDEWQYIWLDYRIKNGLHLEYLENMKNIE
ncbi:MAG: hypothetical protein HFE44_04195 [Oscillospiraceae bacterium]|jgi:hypothetical protein|nr:hypothetical protein [Oscillospiraceae bacterium]